MASFPSESTERLLRKSYSEIIGGFSIVSKDDKTIFLKHFSTLDGLESDFLYSKSYARAAEKGYPTEKQRLEQLEKDRLWTNGDENNLEGIRATIKSFAIAKKKAFLKRDIDSINDQIKEQELLFAQMWMKREMLIGSTVEKFTKKSVDAYLISKSFFKNIQLTELFFTEEEFDDLESNELGKLFTLYNETLDNFSELNVKKIALSNFFQNAFSLSESIYEFYGKSICYLTNFQIQLSAYGSYYKNILQSEMRPPDDVINDPEKLEDWYSSRTNAEQMLDKNVKDKDGNVSVFGATPEDLKNWGYEHQGNSLAKATKEAGGELSMEEMMKIELPNQ